MRLRLFLVAVCLFAINTVAQADVLYTFTISGAPGTLLSEFNGTATFVEPSILTTTTEISGASLTTTEVFAGARIIDLILDPVSETGCGALGTSDPFGCVQVGFADGLGIAEEYGTLLTSLGTYNGEDVTPNGTVDGSTTLSITQVTPEPSSISLFGTGLLGLVGVARRRSSQKKTAGLGPDDEGCLLPSAESSRYRYCIRHHRA
ncbi:PEP-CTERM sorting domain-containing protein [Tunturiibacter empetritectus]|uniref:Ice-binding protein C-terminal domain-containing protein n=2 Tax=Tunturiibacter TaxID=3154218 RepID=A0A852VFE1_9BACT|nr:PEP-CTERM sorting domain-containing protein [Edaphobacter lichenicola]NYF88965.1 hypothetical protein [Edaphobacter lichenicola]